MLKLMIATGKIILTNERKRILTHPLLPNLPPIPVLTESTAIFLKTSTTSVRKTRVSRTHT